MNEQEQKEMMKKNAQLRFDNAQLKDAARMKVRMVIDAQVDIEEANEKLDEAKEIGKDISNFELKR